MIKQLERDEFKRSGKEDLKQDRCLLLPQLKKKNDKK